MTWKIFAVIWFSFGMGFYSAIALYNRDTFKQASFSEVMKGLVFGVVVFPLAMLYLVTRPKPSQRAQWGN